MLDEYIMAFFFISKCIDMCCLIGFGYLAVKWIPVRIDLNFGFRKKKRGHIFARKSQPRLKSKQCHGRSISMPGQVMAGLFYIEIANTFQIKCIWCFFYRNSIGSQTYCMFFRMIISIFYLSLVAVSEMHFLVESSINKFMTLLG